MTGPFDFLHIKRRTAGSSNELSFSVLDAACEDQDAHKQRNARIVGPKPSQGTYQGVTGTATFSSAPEVERRKRARRAHSLRIGFMAVLAVAVLIGAGAFFGYRFYQDKMDFTGRYASMIAHFADIDKQLVEVDSFMENPLTLIDQDAVSRESPSNGSGNLGATGSSDSSASSVGDASSRNSSISGNASDSQGTVSGAQDGATARSTSSANGGGTTGESRDTTSNMGYLAKPAADVFDNFPSMKRELNAIVAQTGAMWDSAQKNEDSAALSQLELASVARLDMISAAEEAAGIAKTATTRVGQVNTAWNTVLEADSLARDATEKANGAETEQDTIEARKMTESARGLFQEARDVLATQEAFKPRIDFSDERAYLEKRIESLDAAIRTANALVSNNRDGAQSANEAYNAADRTAAALAEKLPASEAAKTAEAYREQLEEIGATYEEHRAGASTADSAIRSYLQRS